MNKADLRVSLAESEWNFSKLPAAEFVACCYWEYARESAFIRDVVEDQKDVDAGKGSDKSPDEADRDSNRLHSVGTPAHLIRHAKFPEPWQLLPESERQGSGKNFKPEIPVPENIPAFRVTGDLFVAAVIHGEAERVQKAQLAIYQRLSEIDRGMANPDEADKLRSKLAEPLPSPIVRGIGGVDSVIAQINWCDFTDKKIKECFCEWVDNNRPAGFPEPSERGHKLKDWRASLERLGIMRLMHHRSFDEMTAIVQAALPPESADREKYTTKAGCKKERQKALEDFRELYPFLSDEKPRSWELVPGDW
jgi:hypothetical protein